MPTLYLLLAALILPAIGLTQPDSLLQSVTWRDEASGDLLRLTEDGTFEFDYGQRAEVRYLMGRYTISEDDEEITLGVDYLIGKRRLHPRYRRERDFYLTYAIVTLTTGELVLKDVLTGERTPYTAQPHDERADPAERRIPKPDFGKLKLPKDW